MPSNAIIPDSIEEVDGFLPLETDFQIANFEMRMKYGFK